MPASETTTASETRGAFVDRHRTPETAAAGELPAGLLTAAAAACVAAGRAAGGCADPHWRADRRRLLGGAAWQCELLADALSSYHGMARDLAPDARLGDYLRYLAAVADYADGSSTENPG